MCQFVNLPDGLYDTIQVFAGIHAGSRENTSYEYLYRKGWWQMMSRSFLFLPIILLYMTVMAWASDLQIVDKPIQWSAYREQLIREYAQTHYGKDMVQIEPQAVVVHWTAAGTWESTYRYFYHEVKEDGTLNVASHFLVDRDGTVYRLTPETVLNRHAIGYNWCAIGIENVGGVDGKEDLTKAQLEANSKLICYLQEKYPAIRYVFGHYQQDAARSSGLPF